MYICIQTQTYGIRTHVHKYIYMYIYTGILEFNALVFQCVAMCCSVLQCVAGCCSIYICVLQCVVVYTYTRIQRQRCRLSLLKDIVDTSLSLALSCFLVLSLSRSCSLHHVTGEKKFSHTHNQTLRCVTQHEHTHACVSIYMYIYIYI
jgi:hypothetical protein